MRTKAGRNNNCALPHSERAGAAVIISGERVSVHRALRDLPCSRCAGVIREGDLFTRRADKTGGVPLVRCCRACVQFTTGGRLLDALFVADRDGTAAEEAAPAEVKEKVLARLGPALEACQKGRGGGPASRE